MRGTLLGALLSTLLVTRIFSDTCTWNNCNDWSHDQTVINVHVVPHTHDDMGWKKTADDYYTGAHPPGTVEVIYPGVQYVINTVLNELSKEPTRRFSYCETGYLTRWLEDPTQLRNPKQVQKLKNFVTNGQLELIGGGWVQPDEATSHYTDLIDQYTLGLTKLQETFNSSCAKPKVSWQIDPFGHSREHGNLAAMIGYEGLFFAREHYLEHTYRVHNKTLEFQWKVSEDLDNTITTGAFYNMYNPPEQFNWDVVDILTNPIIDDKKLKGYNLDWYLWDPIFGFIPYIINQRVPSQVHNHVLLLMGSDFLYSNANMWFTNMDKLIKHVNAQSPYKINMFYSTPACYLKAVNEWFSKNNGTRMTSKKGQDFFPYAYNNNFLDGAHSYWSGFYTSKPAFKGLVRESSALLQLIRKINAISLDENVIDQNIKIQKLERAVALSQHHDAITGTSKDAVTQDYIRRLLRGWDAGETSLNNALTLLSPSGKNMQNLKICRKMNETDCHDELMGNQKIAITVFNGHIQPVESLIRLPYYNNDLSNDLTAVSLYDSNGTPVYNKIFSILNNTDFFNHNPQLNNSNSAPYEIYFKANVGALGYNTYFLDLSTPVNPPTLAAPSTTKIAHALQDDTSETTIQNDYIRLYFDKNGKLYQYEDLSVHMNYSFEQDFLFYEGYGFILPVTNKQQSSGAYVFRPANNTPQSIAGSKIYIQVIRSKDVQEVRQIFSNWASQSIRLIQGKPYAEFEWTVGPVPTGSSKEVITRYTSSNLTNNGVFQTDSNGRQMITRKLNYNDDYTYEPTEPVASNYYPVNTRILINDPSKNLSFVVLTDRSQGGSSLNNGEIELMLHRRDFFDDGYGVNEALNELGTDGRGLVVRGKHWVFFGSSDTAVSQHRTLAMEMYNTPFVGLSQYDSIDNYTKNYATSLTGISVAQNKSANLLTLKQLDPETILLRLEHVFQKNENLMYSNQPAIVDLSTLFPKLTVNKVQEMNLVGTEAVNSTVSNMIVTLTPMQIKTFLLNVSKKN